jgi:pimeloyl-ACP methyl ester carboxylesterase
MNAVRILAASCVLLAGVAGTASAAAPATPERLTFVPLTDSANAVIHEPATTDAAHSRIALLITHPEHLNNFNYFLAPEFARRGYRVLTLNYYGKETTYEEFLAPIAAAIRYLRAQPGIEKVVLVGHSSGGSELTFYQDVAENGPAACQEPARTYPCKGLKPDALPKADAMLLLDINIGSPLRTIAIDPAVTDNEHPAKRKLDVDMFDARNGYDAKTHSAQYSDAFEKKFFAAQRDRNTQLVDEALGRLAKIDKGEGRFKDDEPFTVAGGSVRVNGARPDLADRRLLATTHGTHLLLKADGTTPTQIIPSVLGPAAAEDQDRLNDTAQMGTIRHFLSFYGLRVTADYAITANDMKGIVWRSSANSAPGNVEGITVPTLVMASTCAAHIVPTEIVYDHSRAKDKAYVAVEGADHSFLPCKPEYGDTRARAMNYADAWLMQPGRL